MSEIKFWENFFLKEGAHLLMDKENAEAAINKLLISELPFRPAKENVEMAEGKNLFCHMEGNSCCLSSGLWMPCGQHVCTRDLPLRPLHGLL